MDAYVGRGNSYMEYGHDEGTKEAQKDFLRALHFNPTYTKARICLGYNLQVILYKNILGHENATGGERSCPFWLLVEVDSLQYSEKKNFLRLVWENK